MKSWSVIDKIGIVISLTNGILLLRLYLNNNVFPSVYEKYMLLISGSLGLLLSVYYMIILIKLNK